MMETQQGSTFDRYLPAYDVRSHHQIEVNASAPATFEAARNLDIGRSLPVTVLFAIRGIPQFLTGKARPTRSVKLENFLEAGFMVLEDRPPNEFVMGAVGKFWRLDGGFVHMAPSDFDSFDQPGFAKAALVFTVEETSSSRSLLTTETRVTCTDARSRRSFSRYWRAIGPFSGLIRHLMLGQIKRAAEGRHPAR